MGFSWTENISVGASIDSDDVQEIRDNVDWLDDNKCNTHNIDYRASFNYNEDVAAFSGVNSTDFDTVDTTANDYEFASYDESDREAHNSGDEDVANNYVCTSQNTVIYYGANYYVNAVDA